MLQYPDFFYSQTQTFLMVYLRSCDLKFMKKVICSQSQGNQMRSVLTDLF